MFCVHASAASQSDVASPPPSFVPVPTNEQIEAAMKASPRRYEGKGGRMRQQQRCDAGKSTFPVGCRGGATTEWLRIV
jgi:hypothetical protein